MKSNNTYVTRNRLNSTSEQSQRYTRYDYNSNGTIVKHEEVMDDGSNVIINPQKVAVDGIEFPNVKVILLEEYLDIESSMGSFGDTLLHNTTYHVAKMHYIGIDGIERDIEIDTRRKKVAIIP